MSGSTRHVAHYLIVTATHGLDTTVIPILPMGTTKDRNITQPSYSHTALRGRAGLWRHTSQIPVPELWPFHELLWKEYNKVKRYMFLYFFIIGNFKLNMKKIGWCNEFPHTYQSVSTIINPDHKSWSPLQGTCPPYGALVTGASKSEYKSVYLTLPWAWTCRLFEKELCMTFPLILHCNGGNWFSLCRNPDFTPKTNDST